MLFDHHLNGGGFFPVLLFCMNDMNDFPAQGQFYQDDRGVRVTIVNVEEKCVVFMRDGYPHLCMRPMYNFLAKFRKIMEKEDACTTDEGFETNVPLR